MNSTNKSEDKNQSGASLAPARGYDAEAYKEGWKCGRSKNGEAEENPYHRLSKKRKAWMQGWLDGGSIYLTNPHHNAPDQRPEQNQKD